MAAISVPIWQNLDNFFFNLEICQEFGDILLHAYDFLEDHFPNLVSYFITYGDMSSWLSTTRPQKQVSIFK